MRTPDGNGGRLPARLAAVNPTVAFVLALVVVLAGLFAPGPIGAALLLVLAGGLGALTVTTWPVQEPAARLFRLLILTMVIAVALAKVL
ncbi:MAG TPA: DUF6703 family protein [Catenuloplanes sp.]